VENVGLPLALDALVVSAEALGRHAMIAGDRLDLPQVPQAWWSPERMAELLTMVTTKASGLTSCVSFSTMDSDGRRSHGGGWFRVSLDWIGVAAPDRVSLAAEWRDHEAAVEARRAADAAALAAEEAEAFAGFEPIEETRV
jgi:hypothetical protein